MKENILAIDDDAVLRRLMTKLLNSGGYQVHTVAGGEEALHYLAQHPPPDAIICDLMMPEMPGTEVVAAIRSDPRLLAIPILILTGQANQKDRDDALAAGADHYMTKPFSSYELLDQIRRLLTDCDRRSA